MFCGTKCGLINLGGPREFICRWHPSKYVEIIRITVIHGKISLNCRITRSCGMWPPGASQRVVAQRWEAGAYVCGEVATFPLVPRVVEPRRQSSTPEESLTAAAWSRSQNKGSIRDSSWVTVAMVYCKSQYYVHRPTCLTARRQTDQQVSSKVLANIGR